ncbi:uncharacterized protein [Hyperolius riggenbachi]|uniref:uncharacterized protein n=1 Tax=Hyperolius riggenbachi TaxID=752182 RepID=UPI0035A3975D
MGSPEKNGHLKKINEVKGPASSAYRSPCEQPASRRTYQGRAGNMPAPSPKEPRCASEPPDLHVIRDSHPTTRSTGSTSAGAKKTTHVSQNKTASKEASSSKQYAYGASSKAQAVSESSVMALLSQNDIQDIERQTRGQYRNQDWHHWRQNRITASLAHQISHSKFANQKTNEIPQSYLKAVLGTGPRVQTKAMSWGVKNEKNAVRNYERQASKNRGREVQVEDCGLFIHPTKNWLAASPDGIVKDKNTGEELCILEVKCPYKHREHTVREACADRDFCLAMNGDSFILKPKHSYYTQVQCQLASTGMENADFVVYTNKETVIVPVNFDPEFWEETEPKLEKFYREAVLPQVKVHYAAGKDQKKNICAPEE